MVVDVSALVKFLRKAYIMGGMFHVSLWGLSILDLVHIDKWYHIICLTSHQPVAVCCVLAHFHFIQDHVAIQSFNICCGVGGAVLLAYTLLLSSSELDKTIGLLTVQLVCSCACLSALYLNAATFSERGQALNSWHRWLWCWPLILTTGVGIGCVLLCPDTSRLPALLATVLFVFLMLMIFGALLDACVSYFQDLQMEKEHNVNLLEAMFATARLRGCPSLFNGQSEMDLMSANNTVVVKSSAKLDELFGKPMLGVSLDKSWVVHHAGRQKLKGLFCKDSVKSDGDLMITFSDVNGCEFLCQVAVPPQKPSERERGSGRELLVGFRLISKKKPAFEEAEGRSGKTLSSPSTPTSEMADERSGADDDRLVVRRRTPTLAVPSHAQSGLTSKLKKRLVDVRSLSLRSNSDSPVRPGRLQSRRAQSLRSAVDFDTLPVEITHDPDEDLQSVETQYNEEFNPGCAVCQKKLEV